MDIIKFIVGLFTGSAGGAIGGAVSKAAHVAAVLAAVAPIALWLNNNRDEIFIALTYGDLAFWGAMIGLQLFLIVRLVHRAPPPQ
jgi:hypothetical protein